MRSNSASIGFGSNCHGAFPSKDDIEHQIACLNGEAGALDDDARAADLIQEYEARIAALERLVGKQALELEFLKGALRDAPRPRSANTSVITGPAGCRSHEDVG